MQINLVTQNKNKVKEFRSFLEPDIEVVHLDMDYPELRSDDPTEIVRLAAQTLANKLNKTIVVEDSGLFIEALKDFPGTCTAYIHKRIGNKGLLLLMQGKTDRKIEYRSAIGYCEPGKDPVSFLGIEQGTLAEEIRGTKGWGQDPLFIPKDNDKTYGETRTEGDINLFRKRAIEKFKEYLKKE